jgi:hypothetical protein
MQLLSIADYNLRDVRLKFRERPPKLEEAFRDTLCQLREVFFLFYNDIPSPNLYRRRNRIVANGSPFYGKLPIMARTSFERQGLDPRCISRNLRDYRFIFHIEYDPQNTTTLWWALLEEWNIKTLPSTTKYKYLMTQWPSQEFRIHDIKSAVKWATWRRRNPRRPPNEFELEKRS